MWRLFWLLFATINCMVYGCEGSWFFGSSSPLVPKTKVENLQKALMAPMAPTAPMHLQHMWHMWHQNWQALKYFSVSFFLIFQILPFFSHRWIRKWSNHWISTIGSGTFNIGQGTIESLLYPIVGVLVFWLMEDVWWLNCGNFSYVWKLFYWLAIFDFIGKIGGIFLFMKLK